MEIIVGSIVTKNDKVLMIKEAKKDCHGKLAFPAGHLEKNENVFEGAIRETKEETGCEIQLKKVFPIITSSKGILMVHFLADLINDTSKFDTDEIIDVQWIDLKQIKDMPEDAFRSFSVLKFIIECLEKDELLNIDTIKDIPNL